MSKISIITATYNSEETILETYQSIKSQTFSDWEWLVTDDCSIDNTLNVLKKIQKTENRLKIYENPVNSGAAISRNVSIKNATSPFIAFLDSDDLWHENKLKLQIDFMDKNEYDFSFTPYELIDALGNSLNKTVDTHDVMHVNYSDMLKKRVTLGCSSVILRKSRFDSLSMPLLRTGQDYALWLKLLKTGLSAHKLNIPLTKYRILPNSISRNKFKKAKRQWQIYRKIENLPFLYSLECFVFYVYRAVFRK